MTPVQQVELTAPLCAIHLPAAVSRCMLIFRWNGRVAGTAVVPARKGVISVNDVRTAVQQHARADAIEAWIDEIVACDQQTPTGMPSVSVAICTRERPTDLARALEAVVALRPAALEIIVVDNAPTSTATYDVVKRFASARYVREDRRGLDTARNRALREARGHVVAFTDDDAAPEPAWLAGLLPNFADPCVMAACGLTLPLELETEGQELFEEYCTFIRGFRRRGLDGQRDNPFAVGPAGAGANMAVRREAVLRLGGFDERLDGGTPTRSGGDHDLFARMLLGGHRIVYEPAAVSWHRHRRTKEELLETVYGYGVGVYAMWTGLLVERGEIGVARLAWQWLRYSQVRNLFRRRSFARRVAWHEIRGCLHGPRAWLSSQRLRPQGDSA